MGFNDLKIWQKLSLGFLLLIVLVVVMGYYGISGNTEVSDNYQKAIELEKESLFLDQKLNDHYVWMDGLTDQLIHDKIFDKQLDWTKCGFGKWYYGIKDTEQYSHLTPEEKHVFDQMEQPHKNLHESGRKIKELFG